MTNRQKALGVQAWAVDAANDGNWLSGSDAMLAKLATLKKGKSYSGFNLIKKWLQDDARKGLVPGFMAYADDALIWSKVRDAQPYWFGISITHGKHFNYSDTYGLDTLWVN